MDREETNESNPQSVQRVVIASTNPVKVNAAKAAFVKCFPSATFEFISSNVPTGVSTQPMTDKETEQGSNLFAIACLSRF